MMAFLLSNQNLPFTVSLVLMLAIAMLEGVSTLIGAGCSDLLDAMLPDLESACFEQGTTVLIVSHQGAVFKAIENPSTALTD